MKAPLCFVLKVPQRKCRTAKNIASNKIINMCGNNNPYGPYMKIFS